jgi:outer membrane receptor protein involved in Fe transport
MHSSIVLLCLFIFVISIYAGTTGKIAGRITEKGNGEPIAGANITLKGTYLGAASDVDGYYTILNIPPGAYTIEVSMIGYSKLEISDAQVRIDQTTKLNFEIQQEAIISDAIVIVAERKILKEDVATSVAAIRAEEIATLPVSDIESIVGLQAGIEDNFVIRGGGADEALFQMDGVTLRDPKNNKPITSIALSSVQEISVERGGFNAEYGQVRSGIINVVTKEGSRDDYYFSATSKYSPPVQKHFGISPFDPNSMWNRPYLDPEVAWEGTTNGAWDIYTQQQYPDFDGWNAISEGLLTDDNPENDLTPEALQRLWKWQRRKRPVEGADYNIDAGLGGPLPFGSELGNLRFFSSFRFQREMLLIPLSRDDYRDYTWTLKLNSDIQNNMKLTISSMVGQNYNVAINETDRNFNNLDTWGIGAVPFWNPTDYMRTPYEIAKITNEQRPGRIFVDSWYSHAKVQHNTHSVKLSHILSNKTYYNASIEYLNRKYNTEPVAPRDLTQKYTIVPGLIVDEAPFGYSSEVTTGVDGMFFGGHTASARDWSDVSSLTMKFDFSSQLNFENLMKAGMDFTYYDIFLHQGFVGYGNTSITKKTANPYRLSLYMQDKLETDGLIVNLGLRFDMSNPNVKWIDTSPYDDFYTLKYDPNEDYELKDAQIDYDFSPRLGISHPITENSKLFFNYGHFKQMPEYENLFREDRSGSGKVTSFGNPNLSQAKTTSYELGYDHVIADQYLLQLSAFYHDIKDQQFWVQYLDAKGQASYFKATNNSYEDIRGLELTFRKDGGNWWYSFVNYTYQVASSGYFGKLSIYESISEQRTYDRQSRDFIQDRPLPQPRANLGLTLFTPSGLGPSLYGFEPWSNWNLNILGKWEAGQHITYSELNNPDVFANLQVKDFIDFQLRIHKAFYFEKFKVRLFAEIFNLFNYKYLSGAGFYNNDDYLAYMRSLHLPKSKYYSNITGDDQPGDYRQAGVAYQPIEQVQQLADGFLGNERAIYYEASSGKYFELADDGSAMVEVTKSKMNRILDKKAYIDMPNQTSFNFLNPRQIFFGVSLTYEF